MSIQTRQQVKTIKRPPIRISKTSIDSLDKKVLATIYWAFVTEMASFQNTNQEKFFFETIYDPTKNTREVNRHVLSFILDHLTNLRETNEDELQISVYELMYQTLNVTESPTTLPKVTNLWMRMIDSFEENEEYVINKWFSKLPIQMEYENALDQLNYLKYLAKARPWFV
jgi:hypothetical protein